MIDKYILKSTSTLEDLLINLDKSGEGFLPIVDDNNVLIGVITDGDIRRAFLNKVTDVHQIINKKPSTAEEDTTKEQAIAILKKSHRRHLPIINQENKLIRVVKLDNWEEFSRPNKVVIMAGGLGSRLGELTKDIPKPMLPLGNKPILENVINSFKSQGYTDFIISLNYKAEIIRNYFKDGSQLGVNINYVEETERKGTAGAISLIKEPFTHPFFVINGDILTTINFTELMDFHIQKNAIATMCVAQKSYTIQYGVVEFDETSNIVNLKEKPQYQFYINAGIYVLNPDVVNFIPKNEFFDMPSLFEVLKKNKLQSSAYQMNDYWLDIGLKDDYYRAINDASGLNE
jgi:dTDP-glucose pyrophosphorylase